jgi:hypothetical protein
MYNRDMKETVKITVTANGKQFAKIMTITSDGSFVQVDQIVRQIVASEFAKFNIEKISWNYV